MQSAGCIHPDRVRPKFTNGQRMKATSLAAEQRVILHGISWSTFERLLAERGDQGGSRVAYDGDVLEIMSPAQEHERGTEPDAGFYVTHAPEIRENRTYDPVFHPPQDLVIEVDITRSSINKKRLYAELGVPEFWRTDGERVEIYELGDDDAYELGARSPLLPILTVERLEQSLSRVFERDENALILNLRESLSSWRNEER